MQSTATCPLDYFSTLFEVAVRSELSTLSKLLYPELWSDLQAVLACNLFWHQRCLVYCKSLEYTSSLDWKAIYNSLALTEQNHHWSSITSIAVALALELAYGKPDKSNNDEQSEVWQQVRSPQALQYMLENDMLVLDFEYPCNSVAACACLDLVDMLDPLVQVTQQLTKEDDRYPYLVEMIIELISDCSVQTIDKLICLAKQVGEDYDASALLGCAMQTNNRDMIECMYRKFTFELEDIVSAILDSTSILGLQVSLEKYPEMEDKLDELLQAAIDNQIVELVEYLQ
ncbi:Hypothetical protein POVR2_LOCUS7 [uncultured virus]|nr:Hypothetical protein POVR2_LOCUS7 [uncultured virus]